MQSIIETLANGNWGLTLGITLVGAFAVQSVLLVFNSLQRTASAREQHRLARERLHLQIKAAQLRVQEAEAAKQLWSGCRKFQIAQKRQECDGVWSFRLEPPHRQTLPAFQPGQ